MKPKFITVHKNHAKSFQEVVDFLSDKGIEHSAFMIKASIKEVKEGEWADMFAIWKERKDNTLIFSSADIVREAHQDHLTGDEKWRRL